MLFSDLRRRYGWTATLHEVSSDEAEMLVLQASSKELVDELYGFGSFLLNEAMSRTAQLDVKAIRLLIWAAAAVAFLLVGPDEIVHTHSIVMGALTGVALLLAVVASVHAALALHVQNWEMPSERDWFRGELFADPIRLRVYHLLGFLETHRNHNRRNIVKGERVRRSQWSLVGTTAIIVVVIAWEAWT
jgi:hypothetical protein